VLAGHVAVHAEEVSNLSGGVEHRRDHQFRQIIATVLAPIHQGASPWTLALDGAPELLIDGVRCRVAGQNGFVLADDIVAAVAGKFLERRVGVEDVGSCVGDGDGDRSLFYRLEIEPRRQWIGRVADHERQCLQDLWRRAWRRLAQEVSQCTGDQRLLRVGFRAGLLRLGRVSARHARLLDCGDRRRWSAQLKAIFMPFLVCLGPPGFSSERHRSRYAECAFSYNRVALQHGPCPVPDSCAERPAPPPMPLPCWCCRLLQAFDAVHLGGRAVRLGSWYALSKPVALAGRIAGTRFALPSLTADCWRRRTF